MIVDSDFQKLLEISESDEGLVLLGAGGDLNEWVDGITGLLKDNKIAPPNFKIDTAYKVTTSGGRTDLLLIIDWSKISVGQLALWRIRFGDCSWLSDYVVNYADQH